MPQVIQYVGVWLLSQGVPAWLINAAWHLVVTTVLSTISSKLFGPKIPDALNSLRGVSVMRESAVEYRKIVYGQAAVSGPVIYKNLTGTNREYLWYAIALCEGAIEDYVSVMLDGNTIPKADISWSAGTFSSDGSGTGDVSTGKYVGDNSQKAVNIFYTLGYSDQPVLSKMNVAFSDWLSNHRVRGTALLVCKFLYNQDTEKVWQTGAPNNIKAVVKGRKIYDPRLDSTQIIDATTSPLTYGAGTHRVADSTTWEWSDNPALCVADYLVNFMGVSATTSINWPSIADAADDCDVLVFVPPAASPSNTETRFTCNGSLSLGSSHKDNLDRLISSCDGKLSYTQGQWKLRASVWEASSVSFDEDDLAGNVEVRGAAPKSERFNSVRGIFVDPARKYEVVEFPHITNSTYLTRDNSVEIMYDLELGFTNSATMAQRIAFRLLEQSNNQIIAKIKTNARGAKAAIGDVVSLTVSKLSWSSKTFRVVEWQGNQDGTFDLTLREDVSTSYDDPIVADYIDGNSATITVPTEVVPPPTAFSASSVPYGIKLSWTNPATSEFDYIDVYVSSTSAWSGASKIASVRTNTYTHALGAGTVRYYWVRARRNSGDVSTRAPDSDTSTVTSTSGSGTDSVNLVGATIADQLVTAGNAEVAYRLTTGGEEESYEGSPASPTVWDSINTWLLAGASSSYECRLTKVSGTDPTSGNLATWEALSSTRTWVWTDSVEGGGPVTFNGTVELRDTASPASLLASATLDVTVEKQAPTVTLSGTTGSPNVANDFVTTPTNAYAGWRFNSDGTVDKNLKFAYSQFNASTEWIIPNSPSGTYYIRATNYADSNPDVGPALNTWLALTSDRSWYWQRTSVGVSKGTLKIEIGDDASPVNILAIGYYKGYAEVDSGL